MFHVGRIQLLPPSQYLYLHLAIYINFTRMARGASPVEGSLFVVSDHQWIDRVLSEFVFRTFTMMLSEVRI